jgi:hypothetical protein
VVEGVLLATGLKPIPEKYSQGMLVPFRLIFWDQFWNEISVDAKLSVDRSTTPRPKLPRPKSSLRDPERIPEISEPVVSQVLSGLATPDVRFPKGKEKAASE